MKFPAVVLAAALAVATRCVAQTHQDQLNLAQQYQTIDNFGASDAWSIQKIGADWSDASKNRLADLLFSQTTGIGLSLWRFNIGAGINTQTISDPLRTTETFETAQGQYDWTRQAGQRWFLAAAKARGVPNFLAFSYSPTGRMTRNGLTNTAGVTNTTNLKDGFHQQYATYLADVLQHFRDNPNPAERINFAYVSPINEPQWEWQSGQEGNRADTWDIGQINATLFSTLQARGLQTQIIGPDSGTLPDMYTQTSHFSYMENKYGPGYAFYGDFIRRLGVLDTRMPAAMGKTFSYHSYFSDDPVNHLIQDRQALRQQLNALTPDWKVWQSEYCVLQSGRDLTMNTALNVARVIHYDLTVVNASACDWWLAVSPYDYKDGLIYTDWKKPGDAETIYPSKTLWALGNYSRFVRPGMRRVDLAGENNANVNGLLASAYEDPSTGKLAVVYVNMTSQSQPVHVNVGSGASALVIPTLTPYITSDTPGDDLRAYATVPGNQSVTIPPRAVETLVGFARVPGDINGDGAVNFSDLLTLAQHYGSAAATWDTGDLNFDGSVGFDDLMLLAQHYGQRFPGAAASPAASADINASVPEPFLLLPLTLGGIWLTLPRVR